MSSALIKEQWCVINFCVRLGRSPEETLQLLQTAYGQNSLKIATVHHWHQRFQELRFLHKRETLEDVVEVTIVEQTGDEINKNNMSESREASRSVQRENDKEILSYHQKDTSLIPWSNMLSHNPKDRSVLLKSYKETEDISPTDPGKSSSGYQLTSTYNRPRISPDNRGSGHPEFAAPLADPVSLTELNTMENMDGPTPARSPSEPPAEPTAPTNEARKENCCDKFLTCLSHVPCASLIAWIILLLGLGGLTGSLLYGVNKCRKALYEPNFWWFMEFTVIGVVVIMFVLGTLFLVISHLSSDPTNRYVFNTSKKNMCARGLNVFVLFLAYFLAVIWVAASSLAVMPLLVSTFILSNDFIKGDCIELKYYGLDKKICDPDMEVFLRHGKELFTCYIFTYVSAVLVTISMIHFLIAVSANYTHLKDSRFATYNAYETEDVRNSKHSILDTNM